MVQIFKRLINFQKRTERPADSLPLKESLKAFWHMLTPYWTSRDSRVSWIIFVTVIALTAASIYVATAINSWYKEFWDTIQQYDVDAFGYQIGVFAVLATIHVIVSVYKAWLCSRLAINWRTWLTGKVMNEWLEKSTYYKMQLTQRQTDNPDQRIADDLNLFVTSTISLFLASATDLAMMITFAVVLWNLSSAVDMELWGFTLHLPDGYLFYLALVYAVAGTAVTFFLGKPLVKLNFRQQRYEADFRFSLIRVRENAESISLYHGEAVESATLRERFAAVVKNYIRLIDREKKLGFLTLGYMQTAVIFPILIAAPLYFAKIITMGSIMQINSAFGRVQESLSTLVTNFSAWAQWKAVIDRLALFYDSMERTERLECLTPVEKDGSVAISGLEVGDGTGRTLLEHLSLKLEKGQSLLIQGQSGCGKTTLIKTVAGLWPYATGLVEVPEGQRLFLAQKPYLPQGTLLSAAIYPRLSGDRAAVEHYFKLLSLEHLIPLLDKEEPWSHILSLGEQQRVAFVRALTLKPALLILDEATSAMDERLERTAYELILKECPDTILVSVGHRATLKRLHALSLSPVAEGSTHWEVRPLGEGAAGASQV